MENVDIGRYCRIRKAIIEEDVVIPPNTTIGYDLEEDRKHYQVTPSGIVVVAQGTNLPEVATPAAMAEVTETNSTLAN
jgi:glucose-1-phosphate adenylyltransferase